MKRTMRILAASVFVALSPLAAAQVTGGGDLDTQVRVLDATAANKGQTQVADKIASSFTNLAGGKDNATALVNALRSGGEVKLVTATATSGTGSSTGTATPPATTTTTFETPTGKMGWGNVKIALGLAQDTLLKAGITNPTPQQLQTALNGGTLTRADGTTLAVKGVLQMRADGMGWGQIAHQGGTNVGPVVSSLKATNARLAALPAASGTGTAPTATGVTTAAGAAPVAASGKGKGVTTAASATTPGSSSSKGITTATGAASSGAGAKGLVTAGGASATASPKGNAYGHGVVTAAGGGTAPASVAVKGGGNTQVAGVVSGTGASAASGVTHGGGNGNSNGNAGGNGKGKGG